VDATLVLVRADRARRAVRRVPRRLRTAVGTERLPAPVPFIRRPFFPLRRYQL